MKTYEKSKILKLMELPIDFKIKGTKALRLVEIDGFYIIVGICLSGTSIKDKFFIQYFIQPLFIYFEAIVFSIGYRVGSYWTKEDINEFKILVNKIDFPNSFVDLIKHINYEFGRLNSSYKYQTLGYCYFLDRKYELAIDEFNKQIQIENIYDSETIKETKRVITLIKEKEYEKVVEIMKDNQNKMIEYLKIQVK